MMSRKADSQKTQTARYRALVGLTVPVDEAEDARIRAGRRMGNPVPPSERRLVRVEAGDVAAYIPEQSLPWLLEQKLIERVEEDSDGAEE